MTSPLLIGVDGGGTGCRAVLSHGAQRIEAAGPGANASSDPELCLARVLAVLETLRCKSGLSPEAFHQATAYLGLAGVTGPAVGNRIAQALPFRQTLVEEDRASSVMGALGDAPGALAAIGTGSFLARQSAQGLRFQGGYGLSLGDEASGAWLGREALSLVLRAQDGWGAHSDLTQALLARFETPHGVISFAAQAGPQALAELAPQIVQAAKAGDPQGAALMRRGADYIAQGLTALGWQGDPLVLIGGLGPSYADWLPAPLQGALIAARGNALDGALRMAERLAGQPPAP
ncbi:BadF/BadG/BcrA/BcrD ATPase family protein [Tropicibacter oceani]|uniref:BadF/BadG/BcrA/BcrD ATPase family protein n=1 Tax=Tropicibacter oceani TaxID=3058420 RepID=A0ABY8QN50_9RHOB|nr:BadF/BadG/BcrA/BcrD ATPase family protein [Tropicibacter oceani]WGW05451.1 BadF/BadG/BcrA/BcrD ATPase family protein [Tropicibacter oceani]